MFDFYIYYISVVLCMFPVAVLECARMGKLEEERKGVFWLIVPGCN